MTKQDDPNASSNNGVPQAEDGASAHDQQATPVLLPAAPKVDKADIGLPASSLDAALVELLLADPRRFGVAVFLRLVAAWAKESKQVNDRIGAYREENAELRTSIHAEKKHRPLRVAALLAGPVIAGIGLDQLKSEHVGSGAALLVIAVMIIGAALWVGRGGGEH